MRNVWKGLIVGAVTGAAIGVTLDSGRRLGTQLKVAAEDTGHALREHGPELAATARRGAQRLKDADLPGKARDAAQQLADSPAADSARQAAHTAAETLRNKATDKQ